MCDESINNYLWSLWVRARRISIFGTERKSEAILAWRDLLESAKFNYNKFEDIEINTADWWYTALYHLCGEYIALSEFDKAFGIIEELTDTLIEHYYEAKAEGKTDSTESYKNHWEYYLNRCYSWNFPTSDNIIANDPRFKKCEERLAALD